MIVYLVTNEVTGKRYVGKTVRTLARRWQLHRNVADRGEGSYPVWKAAWIKARHGEANR
jgi:hypothetical protein